MTVVLLGLLGFGLLAWLGEVVIERYNIIRAYFKARYCVDGSRFSQDKP